MTHQRRRAHFTGGLGMPGTSAGVEDGEKTQARILGKKQALRIEIVERLMELNERDDNWDGGKAKKPLQGSINGAIRLGLELIEYLTPPPGSLRIGCSQDGTVQFNLDHESGRELEFWVSGDGASVGYVGEDENGDDIDGDLPLGPAGYQISAWLQGTLAL